MFRLNRDLWFWDAGKAARVLGWKPNVRFSNLGENMLDAELSRLHSTSEGDAIPEKKSRRNCCRELNGPGN